MARQVQTRSRGAGRNKATVGQRGSAAEGGKGEQCEEVTVKETAPRRVSRRGAPSQTVAVEIKVEEKVKIAGRRPTRRICLPPFRANH